MANLYCSEPSDHAVAAVTPVRVDLVDSSAIESLLLTLPAVNRALWIMAEEQDVLMRDRITSLGRSSARVRIATLLLELARRLGGPATNDAPITIPITQSNLADAIGVTHIHFNRLIREFCRRGIVATSRGTVIVMKQQPLRDIVADRSEW